MESVTLTILGSGTSHGVPMIGCTCATCRSDDPHDQRTRPSALLSFADHHVLIDTSPELRLQCLAAGIDTLDAVLYTHAHADHIVGIDDLRVFSADRDRPLDIYASAETLGRLQRMFSYAFDDDPHYPSAKPRLCPNVIDGPFELCGRTIIPIRLLHGRVEVLGYRVGRIAYCTDCNRIPDASLALLEGLDVLILDGLRHRPHPTHFNLEQAVAMARRIGARQTYLTHIAHTLPHAQINAELPDGIELAYDGLVVRA